MSVPAIFVTAALALQETGGLGKIHFPTSGAGEAQPHFLRGVAALHNFAYEDAVDAFQKAQSRDPDFALAYWGEAMAYNQTLWLNQDIGMARKILLRLGPTRAARAAKAGTARERDLLGAVEILFGEGDKRSRDLAYAEVMRDLAARYPDDVEVAGFYALALLGTVVRAPALFGESNEEGHQKALAGSDTQREVAAILERVLKSNPEHPGALHYMIHNYDDPDHAARALPAARAYASSAPGSAHALHMPAHIFLQLGRWDEAAASDEAAFKASKDWVERKGLGIRMLDYHSLSWLLYECLQQGRYRKAREALEGMRAGVEASGASRHKALYSTMRAQYVLETRSWEMLRAHADFGNSAELFAIGVSAARSGLPQVAELALQELGRRAGSEETGNRKLDVAVMEKELAALLELAAGRWETAVALLREATGLEARLPPPLGSPRPVKPSHELFGEILLELGRPREAAAEFERSLARWKNRSASVLGLARALARAGDRPLAREHYVKFLENWSQADPELPDLREAKQALTETVRKPDARR